MSIKTGQSIISLVLLTIVFFGLFVPIVSADYLKLSTRSLAIGSSVPGATTDYVISLSWLTSTSIGSIRFLLCEDYVVDQPCPSSLGGDLSGALLTAQTGSLGGFSVASTDTDEILVARGSAGLTGTGMHSFSFDNIVNPAGVHHRFYIQIFTYSSTDGTGTPTHMSSVASATAEPILIYTEVPDILFFCAALTITEWCDSVSGSYIDYGDLSPLVEDAAVSQFGVATNAIGGYVVTISGNTMTAGNESIAALGAPTINIPGVPQFGLNLRANTNPPNGQDVFGDGFGVVAADYNTPDQFKYVSGDIVASAVTATTFNTFTATYIVNVPPDQPSGIYNTTVTYICTAAF
jgi:hypothetical protein